MLLNRDELEAISAACAEAGAWLVLDNTYEDFIFTPGAGMPGLYQSSYSVAVLRVID